MSTWSKGAEIEKRYCAKLTALGWMTRRWPKAKFTSQDLWGADIIAKKQGETRFIQVKSLSGRMPSIRQKDIDAFKELSWHLGEKESIWWVGYDGSKDIWKEVKLEFNK